MISVLLKSVASGSSMTSCAAPAAHAGCTRRRPGRRDSAGALPVRWSVGYPDRPRMPAAGLRRPPSRSARTTWPLWGSSLRAPSMAGDLPSPHRADRLPAATCYPATPEPRPTSIQSGGATSEAKRGAPAAAPARHARSKRHHRLSAAKSGTGFSCTDLGTLCRRRRKKGAQ